MYQNLVFLTYLILCRQGLDYLPHMMLRAMAFKVFVKVPQKTYPIVKPISRVKMIFIVKSSE
jgi:hypothetical protein